MGTTSRGIIYPDASGVPSRTPLQTVAVTADAAIGQVAALVGGQKIQHGTLVATWNSGGNTTTVVNFTTPFGAAPRVFCDLAYGEPSLTSLFYWGSPGAGGDGFGSTTQFEVVGRRTTGTANVRVNWWAIGTPA